MEMEATVCDEGNFLRSTVGQIKGNLVFAFLGNEHGLLSSLRTALAYLHAHGNRCL